MLLDIARRQNGRVSERIQNAPELLPGLQLYVDAFNLLTRSRSIGQSGYGTIPYGEISQFCKDENIKGEDRSAMFFLIGEMDRFFVEFQAKRSKAAVEASKPQPKARPTPPPSRRTRGR